MGNKKEKVGGREDPELSRSIALYCFLRFSIVFLSFFYCVSKVFYRCSKDFLRFPNAFLTIYIDFL